METQNLVIIDERYRGDISDDGLILVLYGRNRFRKDLRITPHVHGYYDFCLVTDGTVEYKVDDQTWIMSAGDLCITKPGEVHQMTGADTDEWEIYFIAVDNVQPPELDMILRHTNARVLKSCMDLTTDIGRILEESRYSNFGWKSIIKMLANTWLFEVARKAGAYDIYKPVPSRSIEIEAARVYIESFADYKLSLADVSREVGISRSSLVKQFAEEMNTTVCKYIRQVLMQRAARMIEEDRLNFSEIADKLGFPSIHYFSTSFKKHWGVAPSEFRRNMRSNLPYVI